VVAVVYRRALTELLIDKIVVAPHPHKIDKDGRRHYLIRAIPYQDPEMEAERLKGGARGQGQDRLQGLGSVGEPIVNQMPARLSQPAAEDQLDLGHRIIVRPRPVPLTDTSRHHHAVRRQRHDCAAR
jgi:hypothetical protein